MLFALLSLLVHPKDRGDMFLRNVSWPSPDYTALHPRRQNTSSTTIITNSDFTVAISNTETLNVAFEGLVLLLCIRVTLGSNMGLGTGCPDIIQSLHANVVIVLQITP
jgi:hypothetical protein